jgi:diguanylate cyclase
MDSSDNFIRAKPFAEAALATMIRHGVPPTPRNFTLWYAHISGSTPELSRTLEILISNGQNFTAERNEELFHRYVGSDSQLAMLLQAGDKLQETASRIVRHVETARGDAQAFGKTLDTYSSKLGDGKDQKKLGDVVAGLLAETKRVAARNELLENQLSQSTGEIVELRQDLAAVRREAMTDALTNIGNRKFFEERMRDAAREAMESGDPLTLLFIDIDHFKRFNDTFGHQLGDQVLRLVAKTLTDTVKGRDTTARFGGEEFAIILPQTRLADALRLAEVIRGTMMRCKIVSKNSGEDYGTITLSIGVALYRPGEAFGEVLRRADAALYFAKRNGRNRVASQDEVPAEATAVAVG